jgi:DNA-binding NtrC family response regulator
MARSIPSRARQGFLGQRRFDGLRDLERKLASISPTPARGGAREELERSGIVARSPAMRRILDLVIRLRDQELPVLITGETGTGKELVARAIHRTSPRRNARFEALLAGSIPAALFEAELFGFEAGAFTDAEEARPGLLEHLDGGTLFLDEVAALSEESQAKLLRAFEAGVVRRLGGLDARPVDVRVIAATSADLEKRVAEGSFRRDLYHRLAGVRIDIPPLRERREDIVELAMHFHRAHARRLGSPAAPLGRAALELLAAHDWPGNARELESVILRGLVTGVGPEEMGLPGARGEDRGQPRGLFAPELLAGKDIKELHRDLDRAYLAGLFRDARGDLPRTAEKLGITLSNLYNWLKRAGLDVRTLREDLRRGEGGPGEGS